MEAKLSATHCHLVNLAAMRVYNPNTLLLQPANGICNRL